MLGNGMYNAAGGRYIKFRGLFGEPKLVLDLRIEYADGTSDSVVSDQSWRCAAGPIVRGSSLRRNGKLLLECSAPVEVLGVSCPSAEKDLEGYVGLEQPGQVTITIALPKAPKQVLFRGQPVTFSYRGGRLEMKVLGSGHLKASF